MSTATPTKTRAPIERTEHPHIVKSADTLGGEPRVDGLRLSVSQIFRLYEAGTPAGEIADAFAPLTLAEVHDAISYAYDHPEEIAFHEERNKLRNVMKEHDIVLVGSRLIARDLLRPEDVPPGTPVYTWDTLPKQEDE